MPGTMRRAFVGLCLVLIHVAPAFRRAVWKLAGARLKAGATKTSQFEFCHKL